MVILSATVTDQVGCHSLSWLCFSIIVLQLRQTQKNQSFTYHIMAYQGTTSPRLRWLAKPSVNGTKEASSTTSPPCHVLYLFKLHWATERLEAKNTGFVICRNHESSVFVNAHKKPYMMYIIHMPHNSS